MRVRNRLYDVLGTGWRFPVSINGRGGTSLSRQDSEVRESIVIILGTARGERRMRPDFGCRIHEVVFAPNNSATWSLVKQYVEEALAWWEARIEVLDVGVSADATDTSRLLIDIKYRVKATSDERSLVYPFYLTR